MQSYKQTSKRRLNKHTKYDKTPRFGPKSMAIMVVGFAITSSMHIN